MDPNYSDVSQDDLVIQILEFVCKNKHLSAINAALIQRDLFPELDKDEIQHLIDVISNKRIPQLDTIKGNHNYLKYRIGLEEYVKNLKKMTKKEKLHKIVEFLSTEYSKEKPSFDSGEIAKAFIPELSINEVNKLCALIIANDDGIDGTTDQSYSKNMMVIVVTPRTHSAYKTKKYLEDDEELNIPIPIHQNISGRNIIVGDISGTVTQEDNTSVSTETKRIPWLKVLYWIIGILVGLTIIITFIKSIL